MSVCLPACFLQIKPPPHNPFMGRKGIKYTPGKTDIPLRASVALYKKLNNRLFIYYIMPYYIKPLMELNITPVSTFLAEWYKVRFR